MVVWQLWRPVWAEKRGLLSCQVEKEEDIIDVERHLRVAMKKHVKYMTQLMKMGGGWISSASVRGDTRSFFQSTSHMAPRGRPFYRHLSSCFSFLPLLPPSPTHVLPSSSPLLPTPSGKGWWQMWRGGRCFLVTAVITTEARFHLRHTRLHMETYYKVHRTLKLNIPGDTKAAWPACVGVFGGTLHSLNCE